MGNLCNIDKDTIDFLPYQDVEYDEKGIIKYVIKSDGLPDTHEKNDIIRYKPSSEEQALNFCKYMNRKTYLECLKEKKEIFELEEINKKNG